ncbi:MAG TPA: TetR family transcriptional regulator [Longimicrobium sp.]|nr:TetR family transcriptional regulator [Longimicrobium sp.]
MSPRPRTASDADVLAAAARAVGRLGPHRLTLAGVAAEAGLAPATLVQRFGSKRGLLLALARRGAEETPAEIEVARRTNPSPLAALRAYAEATAGMARAPEELANHLAFLQIDLTDPDFHAAALAQARAAREGIRGLLDAAADAGELAPTDTAALARAVQTALNGALLMWALFREGDAGAWVRADVDAVLRPFAREAGG